ncbi:hypothetical protein NE865_12674 [Phthorimaea operculella]|nr:hypothetical protein NE865_12674 [Phthorimaea operculella]
MAPKQAPVSLESVMNEIKEVKQQLVGLPVLIQDIRAMKNDIKELKKSCEFNDKIVNEHNTKISTLENKVSEFESLKLHLDAALNEITTLKLDIAEREQRSRLNNVEVKGIPVKQTENLFTIAEELGKAVDFPISKSQINYIARVPTHNPKEKSIILSFNNRYVKEEFLAAGRARKTLTTTNISGYGTVSNIYINDHLTPANKQLLTKAKAACQEKGYQYVWVKHCKIHIRKNDSSNVFIVSKLSDLNKIV